MFPTGPKHWTLYVDPATSFLLTMLILGTTLKLLKGTKLFIVHNLYLFSACDDPDANRSERSRLGKD